MSLAQRLSEIQKNIKNTIKNNELNGSRPTLLAACKGQNSEIIEEAIQHGLTDFGENRVQEAQAKWLPLKSRYPSLRLHLIGPLQTNKAADALDLFDVIQTLDRPKLADEIAKELSGKRVTETTEYFIQVNTGEEPQKAGVLPKDTPDFIRYCQSLQLPVVGLMCIPPADQMPAPHFAFLRKLALDHDLKHLSMGMSDDYETAIRMGSTCIRLGRALFGERS